MMAGFVHSNRAWLKGLTPQLFTEYVDYLLGRDVFGLEIENAHGNVIAGPSWQQLLKYEYAIRKETMRLVGSCSVPLAQALRDSWKNPSLKEVNFTTPTSLTIAASSSGAKKRGLDEEEKNQPNKKKSRNQRRREYERFLKEEQQGGAKGKGRGKGRGKGNNECASVLLGGTSICFNSEGCRRGDQCAFEHVSGRCVNEQAKHPMYSCPENGQQRRRKSAPVAAKLPAVAAGFSEAGKKSEVGQEGAILANCGDQTSGQTLFRPARVLHLVAGKSRRGGLRPAAQEIKQLTKKPFSLHSARLGERSKGVKATRRREGNSPPGTTWAL